MKYPIPASTRYLEFQDNDGISLWNVHEADGKTLAPTQLEPYELIAVGRLLESHKSRPKRLGVAGLITSDGPHPFHLLLGRRGKDPNRGLFVLPGGGVQDNETLEEAFRREIREETGLELQDNPYRWHKPDLIELPDRLILVVQGKVLLADGDDMPESGSDLYEVAWFNFLNLPPDISPVVIPTLASWGFKPGKG